MALTLLLVLILASSLHPAVGSTISISDSFYPYIYSLDPAAPLTWHERGMALRMASSEAVRVNSRGVRFVSGGYTSVAFTGGQRRSGIVQIDPGWGGSWVSAPCRPSRRALCEVWGSGVGAGYSSMVFPNAGQAAQVTVNLGGVNITARGPHEEITSGLLEEVAGSTRRGALPLFLLAVHSNRCPEGATGRNYLIQDPVNSTRRSPIDVSLCNVVGAGGDFVFMPHRGVVYAMMSPIPFQVFLAMSVMTIALVVTLARNLEVSVGDVSVHPTVAWPTGAVMLALLLTSFFANGSLDVLGPYITLEDRFSFVVISSYVGYYILRMGWDTVLANPINPVLGTLVLVSMRLHSTLDNPYSTLGAFLLSTRLLGKVSALGSCSRSLRSVDILADSVVVSVIVYAGVVPQHDRDPVVTGLLLLQGAFAATTLNRVLLGLHVSQAEGKQKGE